MELRHVSFSYGEEEIIEDFSLSLANGRRICVMGESGRGKTTLMRLMLGLAAPGSGEIIRGENEKPAAVFQEDRLLPWYSVRKNVEIAADGFKEVDKLLEDLELGEHKNKLPKELSGGQQRRAAIARALAYGGEPLLLDEPFKGLDPDMRERIAGKILEHAKGASILLITHDEKEAELLNCDEIIRL